MKGSSFLGIFFFTIVTFFAGCSNDFEQSYASFHDLERLHNLRLQGWFPDILGSDGYNLRETHSIGPIESFGRFSYKNYGRIDSLLSLKEVWREVPVDSLSQFMDGYKAVPIPDWFLKKEEYSGKRIFKKQGMYLIQSKDNSTIYFAYRPY